MCSHWSSRLGGTLDSYTHHRMKGIKAFRLLVGDYRLIYDFEAAMKVFTFLPVVYVFLGRQIDISSFGYPWLNIPVPKVYPTRNEVLFRRRKPD